MTNSFSNKTHVMRIMNDIREMYEENSSGIFVVPEEDNICLLHALVIGPPETPYENGFFYFLLKYPSDYPLKPPHVDLCTTHAGTVRFSPNLYANGKVCLSILGTWTGPSWSSSLTTFSTLLSIQSLMDSRPYHNEPGYEKEKTRSGMIDGDVEKDVSDYNDLITHETLRIAVIEMLQGKSCDTWGMPAALKEIMISHFKKNYQFYENLVQSKQQYDGQPIRDPHHDPRRPKNFRYKVMLEKIVELKEKFSRTEGASAPIYNEIVTKTLMTSNRNVLRRVTESSEDLDDYADYDSSEEGCTLYESESDESA